MADNPGVHEDVLWGFERDESAELAFENLEGGFEPKVPGQRRPVSAQRAPRRRVGLEGESRLEPCVGAGLRTGRQ